MADLTVLISPTPLYPPMKTNFGRFARRVDSPVSRPIMVTLEMAADISSSAPSSPTTHDSALLSPPRNTFKSRPKISRSLPPRPVSAPPGSTSFSRDSEDPDKISRAFFDRRKVSSFGTSNTTGGELIRPAPPLCESCRVRMVSSHPYYPPPVRPTTFWRKTKRSGVTGASYSPSTHLIRRSTYIAAGLSLDKPIADLSALCVESRVGFVVLTPDHQLQ